VNFTGKRHVHAGEAGRLRASPVSDVDSRSTSFHVKHRQGASVPTGRRQIPGVIDRRVLLSVNRQNMDVSCGTWR